MSVLFNATTMYGTPTHSWASEQDVLTRLGQWAVSGGDDQKGSAQAHLGSR
jgi:hypothetical protein